MPLSDLQPDPDGRPAEELLADAAAQDAPAVAERRELLRRCLRVLAPRHARVVRLLHLEGMTLQEAGGVLGVSRERVRQLELQALVRMRAAARRSGAGGGETITFGEPTVGALMNNVETAQVLRNLLRDDGASLTCAQAQMHLREDGLDCTYAEYAACWESLHGGADARGRRKLPPLAPNEPLAQVLRELGPLAPNREVRRRFAERCPGRQLSEAEIGREWHRVFTEQWSPATVPAREPEPVPAPGPAESEGDVSAGNGNGRSSMFERAPRLRGLVLRLGERAGTAQIQEAARAEGLGEVTRSQATYAYQAAFPGVRRVGGRQAGGGGAAVQAGAPGPGPAGAPPLPAPAPPGDPVTWPPPAPDDPLAGILAARRQLAELRRQVEAAGGTLSYKLTIAVSEEVG